MKIQILLVSAFAVLLVRFLARSHTSQIKAWKKIIGILFAIGAVIAVLLPQLTDDIAHALGVGRGADLLLYILSMAFIASQISNYVKQKLEHQQFVRLARRVAIIDANNRQIR